MMKLLVILYVIQSYPRSKVFLFALRNLIFNLVKNSLREKCPNMEFFLVRIFGSEKTPNLDTFHAVFIVNFPPK